MPIRYYPASKIKPNKRTNGTEFILNGTPYIGTYYETFDGEYFTGPNPILGRNEKLIKITEYEGSGQLNNSNLPSALKNSYNRNKRSINTLPNSQIENVRQFNLPPPKFKGEPTTYFPIVLEEDYQKGYVNRYFIKRTNSKGYVTEISEEEFAAVKNGEVPYDVTFWLPIKITWKLTGPLRSKRISQYHTRAGIIDTNKRLVEEADKTFLGIKDFIAEQYDKFARPTE